MKKFKLILMLFFIFIGVKNVYAFDNTVKVYDYAQVLTSEEEVKLRESVLEYIEEYNMDMALVTVRHHEKQNTESYADDFYDYNDFGIGNTNDGLIFVIDFTFGYTDIHISTSGKAIIMYDDYRINNMLDNIAYRKDDGYYKMFESFVKDSKKYAGMGIPSSNENMTINSKGDYVRKNSIYFPIIILIDSVVTIIIMIVLINKNKMVRKSVNANYYLDTDSLIINNRSDRFITTHTSSVRLSSSSSSSGGGSSTHHSSSGVSHGGGGRRL